MYGKRIQKFYATKEDADKACAALQVEHANKYTEPVKPDKVKYGEWIYFLLSGEFVKIGYSTNLHSRMIAFKNANPDAKLIAIIPGSMAHEKRLHKKFKHLEHAREWFRVEGELESLLGSIATLAAG